VPRFAIAPFGFLTKCGSQGVEQGASTLMALPVLLFLPPPPPLVRVSSRKWRCSRVVNSPDANQRALAVRIFNIFNDLIRKKNAC